LFLQYERDLRSESLMDRIADHTGYPVINQQPLKTRNEALAFKSAVLGRSLARIRMTRIVDAAPPWLRQRARTWVVDRFRAPATRSSDPEAREILKSCFEDESTRLAELTGLDVRAWFDE